MMATADQQKTQRKKAHRGRAPIEPGSGLGSSDRGAPGASSDAPAASAKPAYRTKPTERCCAVTGKRCAPSAMIRFVEGPQGIVPDLARRLPGRGVWICAAHHHVSDAVARRAFARSMKR
ncbi:MAG: DUF448 domain-containing protein, partial [Planctomycetota bacterium]